MKDNIKDKMKAFITGIKGFAASYLAKELISQGFSVAGTFRKDEFDNLDKDLDIQLFEADMLNYNSVMNAIYSFKPNYIFHLAGISSVAWSWKNPEVTMKVNVIGTENVLKAVKDSGYKTKVLFVSTADLYSKVSQLPITENTPVETTSPYSKSKLEAEKICLKYCDTRLNGSDAVPVIISRSFNHIGPKQALGFVTSDFAKQIADIEKGIIPPIIKVGNLSAQRDFTDVRDTMKAYIELAKKGKSGEVYNICSGKKIIIKELLDMMLKESKKKITVEVDPEKFRPVEVPILYGSYEKFHNLTGWNPTIPMDTTIKDILTYWRNVK